MCIDRSIQISHKVARTSVINAAVQGGLTTSEAYQPVANAMQLQNPAAAGTFQPAQSFQSAVSRATSKSFPKNPDSAHNIVLADAFTKTTDGRPFLLYQTTFQSQNRDHTIIVFGTQQMLNHMFSQKTVYMDGTFQVCPHLFYQYFTVGFIAETVHDPQQSSRFIPVLHCLFTAKSKILYSTFFRWYKDNAAEHGQVSS